MSHDPAPRDPRESDPADERLSSILSTAQFLVTGTVLLVIAALAYTAGLHSARGGHEGEGRPAKAAAGEKVDVALLLQPTPELITEGKALFAVNCASCHGATGRGDGPAAAALNPKPRNFAESYRRYGGGVARTVRTITEGSPGTAMAAFPSIGLEDRFAIAHYIRSLSPEQDEDKPEDLAWLGPMGGGTEGAPTPGGTPGVPVQPAGPVISIEKAMAEMAEPEPPASMAQASVEPGAGSELYAARCASCHGAAGEGGVRVRMLGSSPSAYLSTRSLGAGGGGWASDLAAFERLVLTGIPGAMPGNGDLSRGEIRDLHSYTQKLRARQASAPRAGS